MLPGHESLQSAQLEFLCCTCMNSSQRSLCAVKLQMASESSWVLGKMRTAGSFWLNLFISQSCSRTAQCQWHLKCQLNDIVSFLLPSSECDWKVHLLSDLLCNRDSGGSLMSFVDWEDFQSTFFALSIYAGFICCVTRELFKSFQVGAYEMHLRKLLCHKTLSFMPFTHTSVSVWDCWMETQKQTVKKILVHSWPNISCIELDFF